MEFTVTDMTCGHCVGRVTKALKQVDPAAQVEVDLEAKQVKVSGAATLDQYFSAVRAAGYTPAPVARAA